jgi:hypothetical protein
MGKPSMNRLLQLAQHKLKIVISTGEAVINLVVAIQTIEGHWRGPSSSAGFRTRSFQTLGRSKSRNLGTAS